MAWEQQLAALAGATVVMLRYGISLLASVALHLLWRWVPTAQGAHASTHQPTQPTQHQQAGTCTLSSLGQPCCTTLLVTGASTSSPPPLLSTPLCCSPNATAAPLHGSSRFPTSSLGQCVLVGWLQRIDSKTLFQYTATSCKPVGRAGKKGPWISQARRWSLHCASSPLRCATATAVEATRSVLHCD